ncbi:MAG TPA: DUF3106 domain-containing protein [Verrucomicrobiae bacterium]|nr:DUF3106 domain-containing protein [Verrucomicrobiae bacterium]
MIFWIIGVAGAAEAAGTNVVPMPPPLPAAPRYQKVTSAVRLRELSPVAYFRVLLGMTPAERERALAQRAPAERDAILRKVGEYEALPLDIRETRLRQTEFRWTLLDLMKAPPAQRSQRLALAASADRPLLEARLRQWDKLPAAQQKAYLEKQDFISFYLRWQASSAAGQKGILDNMPEERRAQWTEELARWQSFSEATRQEMCRQFSHFCDLDAPQQQSTLRALSARERQEMEQSLRMYDQLSERERRQCLLSFGKFATMTEEDRTQFLRNATRWEEMAPSERRLWRQMIQSLPVQPPLPPGFRSLPPDALPPLPPGFDAPAFPPTPKGALAKSTTN